MNITKEMIQAGASAMNGILGLSREEAAQFVLTAALRHAEPCEPVAVKALEWAPYAVDMTWAPSIVGDYLIGAAGHWWLRGEVTQPATDVETAKLAAQADYESRIRSALIGGADGK